VKLVEEYRLLAQAYREMAARTIDPQDRRALELQASAWEKVADEREAKLKGEEPQLPEPA
jgi:hypothetical protein